MTPKRQALFAGIFLTVGFVGLTDSGYLAFEHFRGVVPPCTILQGCEKVTTSVYSTIGPVPVALVGAFYYFIFVIGALLFLDKRNAKLLFLLSLFSVVGFLSSAYFVYLQIFVIKALCLYCMVSAGTSTALFATGMTYLLQASMRQKSP